MQKMRGADDEKTYAETHQKILFNADDLLAIEIRERLFLQKRKPHAQKHEALS